MSATAAFLNVAVACGGAPYVNGSLTVAYLKDPTNPTWNNDAAMKLYRHDHGEVRAERERERTGSLYGVAKAETFVQALYRPGKNPTRAGLMRAASMNYANKFPLPGVVQKTSKTDRFVISQMQLTRFNYTASLGAASGRLIEGRPR